MKQIESHFNETKFKKVNCEEVCVPARFKIESLIDSIEGFRVILKEEFCHDAVRYIINFEDIEQYIVTPKFPDKSGNKFDPGKWSFFVNQGESCLIKRYHEETRYVYADMKLFHFVIICVGNGIIEVLSQSQMTIERLPENSYWHKQYILKT